MSTACAQLPWWNLLWSDYMVHYSYKCEGSSRSRLLFAPRLLTNSSLHVCLLIRLTLRGPRCLRCFWHRVLLSTHGCYLTTDCELGPGLHITHPIGLSIGPNVKVGRDAALFHGITLAGGLEADGPLVVGDAVQIFTGSVVDGALVLGDGCIVGANAVLTRSLRPGEVYTANSDRRDRSDRSPRPQGTSVAPEPHTAPSPQAGRLPPSAYSLMDLLREDYAVSKGRPASLRRLVTASVCDRSQRVVTLVRLMQKAPGWQAWLWRRLLLIHGCDVLRATVIGPGLRLPHPYGIVIGVNTVIGRGATLHQNISMSPAAREWRPGSRLGVLWLGDHVTVMPGAVILGDMEIGAGAVIGPNSVLTSPLTAGRTFSNAPTIAVDALPARAHSPSFRRGAATSVLWSGLRHARPTATRLVRALLGLAYQVGVDQDVVMEAGVALPRPVWVTLGRGVRIASGSRLENRVTIAGGTRVGHDTELRAGAVVPDPVDLPAGSLIPANHVVVAASPHSSVGGSE